jgi:hypothetical protein
MKLMKRMEMVKFKNIQYETKSEGVKNDVTIKVPQGLFPNLGVISYNI